MIPQDSHARDAQLDTSPSLPASPNSHTEATAERHQSLLPTGQGHVRGTRFNRNVPPPKATTRPSLRPASPARHRSVDEEESNRTPALVQPRSRRTDRPARSLKGRALLCPSGQASMDEVRPPSRSQRRGSVFSGWQPLRFDRRATALDLWGAKSLLWRTRPEQARGMCGDIAEFGFPSLGQGVLSPAPWQLADKSVSV